MRTLLLATTTRRQGISFQLKTAGYEVIGTMTLNPATARHEMEISEEAFLKHSKELARLCSIPGLGWYVVEFREDEAERPTVAANGPLDPRDDLEGMRFFGLRKIAKELGIDVTSIKGNEAMKSAIRLVRIGKLAA